MLDRLLSGAGALADIADRIVQSFIRFGRFGPIVAIVLIAGGSAVMAGLGLEATDNPEPRVIGPADIASSPDLGRRTYSTISGDLVRTYVETFEDKNDNGEQDADEQGRSWFYWVVDPQTRAGVTVRSKRTPDEVFRFEGTGVVYRDADYVKFDADELKESIAEFGVQLDSDVIIDATASSSPSGGTAFDWASAPPDDTQVTFSGTNIAYVPTCLEDTNGNNKCDEAEFTASDVIVYDPVSKHGVVVITKADQTALPMTLTGMLRRDAKSVTDAKTTDDPGFSFADLAITVSDQYLFEEGGKPVSAPLAFASSAVLALLAVIVFVGWRIGFVVYRRDERPLPSRARTIEVGERVPVHVTGLLTGPKGRFRVREASADLVRIELEAPEAAASREATPVPPGAAASPDAAPEEPPTAADPAERSPERPSTLILDRPKQAAGALIGSGAVKGLSVGRVVPLRGARPALRLATEAGRITVSFSSIADRDRAVAELLSDNNLPGGLTGRAGAPEA